MSEKVLLTGISGFVAKHVAIELLNSGYEVLGTVRNSNSIEQTKKRKHRLENLGELERPRAREAREARGCAIEMAQSRFSPDTGDLELTSLDGLDDVDDLLIRRVAPASLARDSESRERPTSAGVASISCESGLLGPSAFFEGGRRSRRRGAASAPLLARPYP